MRAGSRRDSFTPRLRVDPTDNDRLRGVPTSRRHGNPPSREELLAQAADEQEQAEQRQQANERPRVLISTAWGTVFEENRLFD